MKSEAGVQNRLLDPYQFVTPSLHLRKHTHHSNVPDREIRCVIRFHPIGIAIAAHSGIPFADSRIVPPAFCVSGRV